MPASRMRSPLGRAIGLGSAKEGVEHWWRQRLTAIALVPLALGFVILLLRLLGSDLETVRHAIARPLAAVALILLLITGFWHHALGLQVIIEDYVHSEPVKLGLIVLVRLGSFALAVAGIFSILRLALMP
jgi:succinate dehydrogenase / fumarate reductase, membrane anchor subunit